MEIEYFLSTDGQCPPRGNVRIPGAADGWISKLISESATLRQGQDLKHFGDDGGRILHNPLTSMVHDRVPVVDSEAVSLHSMRVSLGLPTCPVLPISSACFDVERPIQDQRNSGGCDVNALLESLFPYQRRDSFSYGESSSVQHETKWSFAEDRVLLYLDASCQGLSEGYLSLQQKFPMLLPKPVDAWMGIKQHGERQAREMHDLARDFVEISDPEALRSAGLRSGVSGLFPSRADSSNSDAIFLQRLNEIKASVDRQKILLALPDDPSIFLPSLPVELEAKSQVPPPRLREPTLEERREALRAALYGGRAESREAKILLEPRDHDSFIMVASASSDQCVRVPCNLQSVLGLSPFFAKQHALAEEGLTLDAHDAFWKDKSLRTAFNENTVRKFVTLCHNPTVLTKITELQRAHGEASERFETEYDVFERRMQSRKEAVVESLNAEYGGRVEMTARLFRDMLADDINTLTRVYRQHVSREISNLNREHMHTLSENVKYFDEELGYLRLAKSHYLPTELKALRDRVGVVESVLRKDILSQDDLPALLGLSEAVLASSVRSQLLQAMAVQTLPLPELCAIFSGGISDEATMEYLSLIPDRPFMALYNQVQSDQSRLLHCIRLERERRSEAKLHELKLLSAPQLEVALGDVDAFRNGRAGYTPYAEWEDLLLRAVALRDGQDAERLVALYEGGGRGSVSNPAMGVYDVILCSTGAPIVAATVPSIRIGESASTVFFEFTVTSAFLSALFPFTAQIGLEPVGACLNHVQLVAARDALGRREREKSKGTGKGSHREFRDTQHDRYFGASHATGRHDAFKDVVSPPPGATQVNVSSTCEALYAFGCGWSSDGLLYADGMSYCVHEGYGEGDVIGVALNLLNGVVTWYKNNHPMSFTSISTGKDITVLLLSVVSYKPTVYLQSTATRNAVPDEQGMEGIIGALLASTGTKQQSGARVGLSQQDVLTSRLQLTAPFRSTMALEQGNTHIGFAQLVEM